MDTATLHASQCTPRPTSDDPTVRPTKRFTLAHGRVRSIEVQGMPIVVRCESGQIWLTQIGDGRDIVLDHGQRFTGSRRGRLVLQALADAVVVVTETGNA